MLQKTYYIYFFKNVKISNNRFDHISLIADLVSLSIVFES